MNGGAAGRIMLFLKVIVFTLAAPGTVTTLVPYLLLSHFDTRPLPFRQFRYLGPFPLVVGVCMYPWDFAVRGRGTPAPIDPPRTPPTVDTARETTMFDGGACEDIFGSQLVMTRMKLSRLTSVAGLARPISGGSWYTAPTEH